MISKTFSESFNTFRPKKYVDFLEVRILILQDKNGEEKISAEAFVPGSFKKYSDNLGFVGMRLSLQDVFFRKMTRRIVH